jgi:aryl-alcohol dehydrogenase (NADP+)
MEYVRLGSTGLEVSRICLGCMSYGEPERGGHHPWVLDRDRAKPIIRRALDAGINFLDTANVYSEGTSEEIVGEVISGAVPRAELVLATKVNGRMRPGPNGAGLSRKAIMSEIDNSLRRLKTDYIDLYQIHRWDATTPVEETLEALNDLVRAGKVLYVGASSMFAWQFAKALRVSERHGWARFVTMQDHYNLLYREDEREMHPLCADEGIGVIPWSPMARGRLTRPWDEATGRSRTDIFGTRWYSEGDRSIAERVGDVATTRGVSRAQVALAWLLSKPTVVAPIVGATRPEHLDEAIKSISLQLSAEEIEVLEEPYQTRALAW